MLRKCASCDAYSLSGVHCSVPTRTPHPPKFSAEDRYGKYRRMAKEKNNM